MADEILALFPSGLRDFQHFKSPENDVAEKIRRLTLHIGTKSMISINSYTHTSFLNSMAMT
jgi:hypothetical protein